MVFNRHHIHGNDHFPPQILKTIVVAGETGVHGIGVDVPSQDHLIEITVILCPYVRGSGRLIQKPIGDGYVVCIIPVAITTSNPVDVPIEKDIAVHARLQLTGSNVAGGIEVGIVVTRFIKEQLPYIIAT